VLEPAKAQPQTTPQEESAEPQTNPPEQQTSAPQPQPVIPVQPYPQQPTLLQSFCSRLHTSAILLLIAGILQGIGAIITLIVGIVSLSEVGDLFHRTYYMGDYYTAATAAGVATLIGIFVTGLCMAAICVCDLVIAGRLFSYSKQVQDRPVGILEQYTSTGKLIVLLVFNILFGGIFGIIGAAFLLSASSMVKNNSNAFADMEQNASRF
jgi:MFS family permease